MLLLNCNRFLLTFHPSLFLWSTPPFCFLPSRFLLLFLSTPISFTSSYHLRFPHLHLKKTTKTKQTTDTPKKKKKEIALAFSFCLLTLQKKKKNYFCSTTGFKKSNFGALAGSFRLLRFSFAILSSIIVSAPCPDCHWLIYVLCKCNDWCNNGWCNTYCTESTALEFKSVLQDVFDLNSNKCCIRTTASPDRRYQIQRPRPKSYAEDDARSYRWCCKTTKTPPKRHRQVSDGKLYYNCRY